SPYHLPLVQYLVPSSSLCPFLLSCNTAPSAIYSLSLHDALPICLRIFQVADDPLFVILQFTCNRFETYIFILINMVENDVVFSEDRKSTRLNSSHVSISYAVFGLKQKTTYCIRLISVADTLSDLK